MTPTTQTAPEQEQAFNDADYADPRLRLDQVAWGEILTRNGADYGVWRPNDWRERIIRELGGIPA
jgi:hypothetical protein